jgi:RNA polymerase sigma-70 factor (sigma-E family)
MSEAALIRSRSRPATRLEDLYVQHLPGAVQLGFVLTGSKSEAEDLAHDAFVRLASRYRNLRDAHAFRSYLRQTIVNLHISRLRRLKRERSFLSRARGDDSSNLPQIEERDSLWNQVLQLPPRQRVALVLRYYEDMSEQQTAEVLRCSIPAVKSLVSRGLGSLRQTVRREL